MAKTLSSPEDGRPTTDEDALKAIVGTRIRQERLRNGLTGRRLAALAGVTPAYVSQVEHGQYMPSVATLIQFSEALGVAVGDILQTEAPVVGQVLTPEQWHVVSWPDATFEDTVIAADAQERVEITWSRIQPGGGSGPELFTNTAAMQCIFVLKGKVEVRLGDERHLLREHWSITFPGTMPHGYFNPTSKPSEYLSIVTPAVGVSARGTAGRSG
jgi:transcriptional regulator with XRE-family HTH domain